MKNGIFADIDCRQINCHRDPTCGDHFIMRHIRGQRRAVVVLSDGMGHGVKANILSSLTSSIIVNMMESHEDIRTIASTILQTLPVCSVRKLSYCTFTIVDIDLATSRVQIIEYDNPQSVILRGLEPLAVEWECEVMEGEYDQRTRRTLLTTQFDARVGDRIVFMSDGVPQSGLGRDDYPFGWGMAKLRGYICEQLERDSQMTSYALSSAILSRAIEMDENKPKDDISAGTIHFREPRSVLFCSCPPMVGGKVGELAERIVHFEGPTAVSGYPLAEILASRMGVAVHRDLTSVDPEVPPAWHIEGIDLVTEGLVTLSKVLEILQQGGDMSLGAGVGGNGVGNGGPAYDLVRMFIEADHVQMVIGLKDKVDGSFVVGSNHVDDFNLRRKVIRAIGRTLHEQFGKYVDVDYI